MKDNYWINKEARAKKAKEHTTAVAAQWTPQIQHSVENSIIYTDKVNFETKLSPMPIISIEDSDTVSAIFRTPPGEKIVALNFASYKEPGGKFLEGSSAQEESLCHKSFLYNVLSAHQDYYDENKKKLNKGLYTNRAIYSPDIMFFQDEAMTVYRSCGIITCAAPNWSAASRYTDVTLEENFEALISRIKFILKIAMEQNAETLILGAFGCGVFSQPPSATAYIFREFLKTNKCSFKRVVFAIPNSKNNYNYDEFLRIFGGDEI